ncbi:unnamed protein product [Adineta steineri]|uniref:Polycystin domain-containing protein n=3 Tax=Adineta steineri TaxID=433720 RepID=A0A814P0F9_9BILA|nr:unnamed protein product [Adineta steineri]
MFETFQRWIGWKKVTEVEIQEQRDIRMRSQYFDPIERFPDRIDQLLDALNRKRSLFTYRPPVRANRLNESEVIYARDRRLQEIYMWSIIREIVRYLWFFSLLSILTYTHRDLNSFNQVDHLQKYFLNSRQINSDYTTVSTIDDYWNWLENSFVENIRAQQWYNGEAPRNLSGYINDKTNRFIGWATMRQLRIKSQLCLANNEIILTCQYEYSLSNEDKHSYQPGWLNETKETYSSSVSQSFQYKSSKDLDTYTYVGDYGVYEGGGYVYEFRGRLVDLQSNLSTLHQLGWIDDKTRAVIIQLTLYNPNVQLFTSVTFLAEFLSSSGVYPTARFEPFNFYEVGIIVCAWTSVGIYIWRYHQCERIGQLFKETNGYVYINLQFASYVNDVLTILLGFSCFFGTIKAIKLLRFNQRLCLFLETLKYAKTDLIPFSMMFSIIFIAFLSLFYLLFSGKISSCSSLLDTARMLFEIMLMKFDAHELSEASAFLGPFCFSLFIIFVVFICISMFLSIINDNFRRARENVDLYNQQIFSFMLKKFQRWTGLKNITDEEIQEERDIRMRSQYFDPIERFPDRIDQLLDALNRVRSNFH